MAAHQRAIAKVNEHRPALDRLAEIAKHSPAFKDRIDQLIQMADYTHQLASVALAIDATGQREE